VVKASPAIRQIAATRATSAGDFDLSYLSKRRRSINHLQWLYFDAQPEEVVYSYSSFRPEFSTDPPEAMAKPSEYFGKQ
jgi:hypothetical protein